MTPPATLAELARRAAALYGREVAEVAQAHGMAGAERSTHLKGQLGQLVERLLGATSGSAPAPDFPDLGVELKTIPISITGAPRESTFVCTLPLAAIAHATWESAVLRAKLQHVLWVPVVVDGGPLRFGAPWLWRPSPAQMAVLRADFDEIVGRLATGELTTLTAHTGRWLQLRPKAAHSRVRTLAYGPDDEPMAVKPRGFYLRARFTRALFADPETMLGSE